MTKQKTLAIFTLVEHKLSNGKLYGYGPYIREMNIWVNNFDKVLIVAPALNSNSVYPIDSPYEHENISLVRMPGFNVKSIVSSLSLLLKLPSILIKMFGVMQKSDHLHFRSPSNIAAIAAMVQIFFPSKPKTVKYAGNWDPNSNQPLGYRFQKKLFTNTFLTKNVKILAYGKWENQSQYVLPFYTATFNEVDKIEYTKRDYTKTLKFVFLGTLVEGKRPLLAIQIIEALLTKGVKLQFHMFGDGVLMNELKHYIEKHNLNDSIFLYGNKPLKVIKTHLRDAHFTLLPSKSEGWPKALAEGMFFGAIPISTQISCVPWMLDYGKRGLLIEPNLHQAENVISTVLTKGNAHLNTMAETAQQWSQKFTIERFEKDIKAIITEA